MLSIFNYFCGFAKTVEKEREYVFCSDANSLRFLYTLRHMGELSEKDSDIFEYRVDCYMNCYSESKTDAMFTYDLKFCFRIRATKNNNSITDARFDIVSSPIPKFFIEEIIKRKLFEELFSQVYKNAKKILGIKDDSSKIKYVRNINAFTDDNTIFEF